MLTALGNGVKGGKWYSLMDKVCRFFDVGKCMAAGHA